MISELKKVSPGYHSFFIYGTRTPVQISWWAMACVEVVVGTHNNSCVAGVAVSANIDGAERNCLLYQHLPFCFRCRPCRGGSGCRSGSSTGAQPRRRTVAAHCRVCLFGTVGGKLYCIAWQLWLETRVEHTMRKASRRRSGGRCRHVLFVPGHFCHFLRKKYPGDTTGCVNPRHGLFTALLFSVFADYCDQVAVDNYVYGDNPLFPPALVAEQALLVVWAVLYTWWIYLGLSRCLGVPCSAHESTVVKRVTGVVSMQEQLVVDEL